MIFSQWGLTCKPLLHRPVALATRSVGILAAALWAGWGLLWYRLTRRISQAVRGAIHDILVLG